MAFLRSLSAGFNNKAPIFVLNDAIKSDYKDLKKAHTDDFTALFSRVSLDLGTDNKGDIPTNKRLIKHDKGAKDIALYTLDSIFNVIS